jgi:hypothetical protein
MKLKNGRNVMHLSLPDAVKIESIAYDKEEVIGIPSQLELIEDQLFLFRSHECVAQILSTEHGDQVGCFGQMGQGPYEHISPFFSGYNTVNKEMYIWDVSLKSISTYHAEVENDSILFTPVSRIKQDEKTQSTYYDVHYMTDGKYVGVVAHGQDISHYFSILDKNLKEVERFGNVPFLENLEGLSLRRLNGSIASSQTQFVFAAMSYGYLVSYEITEKNEVNKKWEYYLSNPYYRIENGEVKWEEDNNKMGFYDIKMNSKYIFALYHGDEISHMLETDSIPKHLLVFDLNGHLIKLFELDRQCGRIAVTEGNTIFAGSVEFDSEIVRYDLSKYL